MNRAAVALRRSPSPLRRIRAADAVVGIAVAAALVVAGQLGAPHRFVSRLTFDNPTSYDLTVDVAAPGGGGWMAVAIARRSGATVAEQVYDIGDDWVFRFAGQGRDAGERRFTRAQLERAHWHVAVPSVVGDMLRAQGAPPPP